MKIQINPTLHNDTMIPLIAQVEECGFKFIGFATVSDMLNNKKEYQVFESEKNGKQYHIKSVDRKNDIVVMEPKDFEKLDRIFWQKM